MGDLSGQKNKKRKAEKVNGAALSDTAEVISKRKACNELVLRSEHVLSSVKAACIHDSEGFIDEVSYLPYMFCTPCISILQCSHLTKCKILPYIYIFFHRHDTA